ncbi:hypothetical protein KTI96_11560 [Acinetobacter bereziniae]|uniref:hypothetical protein n=1 Tax=Acinetobacter bereziniae TaxID=106648 RepID=UPI0021CDE31A|nr:hypothetical protein [Acinetobacter bereziniae]MCU4537800.1 hypothetical protein [Acinetobacter bereziniae]
MKIKTTMSLATLLLSCVASAETITFKTQTIPSKYTNFSGTIPFIQGKGVEKINQQIQQELLADETSRIDFSSEQIYQGHDYLSIHIHLEFEGGRSYYREKYYVIDLKKKQFVTLPQILKKYQLSASQISSEIAKQLDPCIEQQKSAIAENCDSADLQYLYRDYAEDRKIIDLKKADGFYLNKDILGISFDAGPFSVPFEYNIKTKQLD